jgi:2TM family of unknown function (DUF5676)
MNRVQPYPVAVALSFVFLILYAVCVILHYVLPDSQWQMYRLWEMSLMGFVWLTPILLLGILEVYLGGFYVAYTLIPLYNAFNARSRVKEGESIMKTLRFKPVAYAITVFGLITYVLCVLFDLLFPQWAMYKLWEILLPGFTWLSWGSFIVGLIGVIVYGVYIAAVFVPIYNYFSSGKLPELK